MPQQNKLTLGVHWFDLDKLKLGKKLPRPFAYTTTATKDLIEVLAETYDTILEIHDHINYDNEAKAVLRHYVNRGFGDVVYRDLVRG